MTDRSTGDRDALSVLAAAFEAPDCPALVEGGQEIGWPALAERVQRRRSALRREVGDRPKPVVAVVGDDGLEAVLTLLALLEDRWPFVLLHPRWTAEERSRAIAMGGACLCVESSGSVVPVAADRAADRPNLPPGAAVVFTSGTSGSPRGAVLSRSALVASARAHGEAMGWLPDDRWLLSLPTAHVGGLMVVVRCLQARRTVVLPGGRGNGRAARSFDPAELLRIVERDRVSLLSVVPTMIARLLRAATGDAPVSLRAVLVGGAASPPALLERGRERGWPVLATYGLTEASSQVATELPGSAAAGTAAGVGARGRSGPRVARACRSAGSDRPDRLNPACVRAPGGVGRPLPGVEVRVASPGDSAASVGPIEVRGPVLFEGYLGATPGAPLERPFDADGWFDTGDLGVVEPDGGLRIAGRRADRIVTGGENVDPLEVEATVLGWPGARAVCVVGIEDEEWGERVAAVVVPADGFEPLGGLAALELHLAGRMADFKRPRSWSFVDELPQAASGKVDRGACARLLAEANR